MKTEEEIQKESDIGGCEIFGCMPTPVFSEDRETIEIICARCGNLMD